MKLIIALDFKDLASARLFISKLSVLDEASKQKILLKVGMWLFYSAGASIIAECRAAGFGVFLDLKLNDIPNTVRSATNALMSYDIDILSVHSAAGSAGLAAAVEGAASRAKIFAITVLTSMQQDDLKQLDITKPLDEVVAARAQIAKDAGCAGCVCSAYEAAQIRSLGLESLCPGIRLAGGPMHDQARVATPEFAKAQGANYIVMGRAILESTNPIKSINQILRSIND